MKVTGGISGMIPLFCAIQISFLNVLNNNIPKLVVSHFGYYYGHRN